MGIREEKTLPKLKELVSEVGRTHMSLGENSDEMITMFVSFDIVNSTLYKTQHKNTWGVAFSAILRRIIGQFSNNPSGGYDFWKTLGDEIIYTKKIGNEKDLLNTLDEIYKSLVLLNQKIRHGDLCDEDSAKMLSIKATVWMADLSSSSEKTENLLTYYQINDKRRQADYIGPDIDAGFRTSYYSKSNRMIISFEIACILLRYARGMKEKLAFPMEERIHLLSSKVLKGVWDGHPYPILIYHGNEKVKFEDTLSLEEKGKPSVFQEYWDSGRQRELKKPEAYASYQEQELERLCEKLKLDGKIHRMMALMERTGRIAMQDVKDLKLVKYSAVCYHREGNLLRFMLVKNKKTGLWGFGEAKFFYNAQFAAQMETAYYENYGAEIIIENDSNYEAKIPLVLGAKKFSQDENSVAVWRVFLASLKEKPVLSERNGGDTILFLTPEEALAFEGDCVPLFHEALVTATEKLSAIEQEKKLKNIEY